MWPTYLKWRKKNCKAYSDHKIVSYRVQREFKRVILFKHYVCIQAYKRLLGSIHDLPPPQHDSAAFPKMIKNRKLWNLAGNNHRINILRPCVSHGIMVSSEIILTFWIFFTKRIYIHLETKKKLNMWLQMCPPTAESISLNDPHVHDEIQFHTFTNAMKNKRTNAFSKMTAGLRYFINVLASQQHCITIKMNLQL